MEVSHYDRDADIVWLEFAGFDGTRVAIQEADWGLVERDSETGDVVAIELWRASTVLPSGLLDALPSPGSRPVVVETEQG